MDEARVRKISSHASAILISLMWLLHSDSFQSNAESSFNTWLVPIASSTGFAIIAALDLRILMWVYLNDAGYIFSEELNLTEEPKQLLELRGLFLIGILIEASTVIAAFYLAFSATALSNYERSVYVAEPLLATFAAYFMHSAFSSEL